SVARNDSQSQFLSLKTYTLRSTPTPGFLGTLFQKIETSEFRNVSKGSTGGLGVAISVPLMESADSTREKIEQTRSVGIDLNEIPSTSSSETPSPDAFAVVRTFHGNLTPVTGAPATVPEESCGSACTACGQPELKGHTVVCDGCERGFHLSCTGMRGRQAMMLDEWMCGECISIGVASSRWPLGLKAEALGNTRVRVQFLDINASPPSDGECEENDDSLDSRYKFRAFFQFWWL
ncbi:hypothetical protein U1Q18_038386, partial [Sarracenia purpurea var. burkii]